MTDSGGGRACGICKRALRGDDEWIALDGGEVWCAECWGARFGGGPATFAAAPDSKAEAAAAELTLAALEAEARHAADPMEALSAQVAQQAQDTLMADMASPADGPGHPEFTAVSVTPPTSTAQSQAAATHPFQWFPLRQSLDEFGRERGVLWGIVLLAGSLLPILVPAGSGGSHLQFVFPLAELGGAPAFAQFFCFYPLVAGTAMILLALLAGGKARGIGMLIVWAMPGVVLLSSLAEIGPQGLTGLPDLVAKFAVSQILAVVWLLMLAVLLLAGMGTGLLVLRARPNSTFGRLTAGLCGAVFLLFTVMPVVPAAFAPFVGSLPIASPFHIMGMNGLLGSVAGITLASLLTVAALSAACLSPKHHPLVPRVAIAVLWGAMVVVPVISFIVMGYQLASVTQGATSPAVLSMVMPIVDAPKFAALFYGQWAPLVLGLIELYVVLAAVKVVPAPGGASSHRVVALQSAEEPPFDGLEARRRLEDLKKLKDANLISELDYEVKKRDLLKRFSL